MHGDRGQARTDVRTDSGADLGFVTRQQTVAEALPEPYHQLVGPGRRGQVVDAHLDLGVAGRLDREVDQPGQRPAGGAHLVPDHDLAVDHPQDGLHRQSGTQQRGRGADAPAAAHSSSSRSEAAVNPPGDGRDVVIEPRRASSAFAPSPGATSTPSRPDTPSIVTVSGTTVTPRAAISSSGSPAVESVTTATGRVGDMSAR